MLMQGSRLRLPALAVARVLVPTVCLAVAVAVGMISPALGQQGDPVIPPGMAERFAFDAADTNGDGFVSEGELARDAAVGFSALDKDRSETLTPEELGPHDPAAFALVDRNGDGVLTFSEVMTNKTRGFEDGDKNRDGLLSFEEMVDEVKAEEGMS
jgi:Ca2+-binding EF-hand superfamily protein